MNRDCDLIELVAPRVKRPRVCWSSCRPAETTSEHFARYRRPALKLAENIFLNLKRTSIAARCQSSLIFDSKESLPFVKSPGIRVAYFLYQAICRRIIYNITYISWSWSQFCVNLMSVAWADRYYCMLRLV